MKNKKTLLIGIAVGVALAEFGFWARLKAFANV